MEATRKFYQCNQKPWQTVEEYAEELKAVWQEMRSVLKETEDGFASLEENFGKHHELVPRYIRGLEDEDHKRQMWEWYTSQDSQRKSGRLPRFGDATQVASQIQLVGWMIKDLTRKKKKKK